MERFVRLVVGGGVALVVGLWVATLAPATGGRLRVPAMVGGLLLAGAGGLVLLAGLNEAVDWRG
jgi:hypothetical protein